MNRVFVLKDKETQGGGIFYCRSGLAGKGIAASDDVFIHGKQEVSNYIKSFLRKEGSDCCWQTTEIILGKFINYLQNIEHLEEIKNIILDEEIEIENRFEILDL